VSISIAGWGLHLHTSSESPSSQQGAGERALIQVSRTPKAELDAAFDKQLWMQTTVPLSQKFPEGKAEGWYPQTGALQLVVAPAGEQPFILCMGFPGPRCHSVVTLTRLPVPYALWFGAAIYLNNSWTEFTGSRPG